jgi:hypothetical protein
MTPKQALLALLSNTYVNYLIDAQMRAREFKLMSALISRIPVYDVTLPDGLDALQTHIRAYLGEMG